MEVVPCYISGGIKEGWDQVVVITGGLIVALSDVRAGVRLLIYF